MTEVWTEAILATERVANFWISFMFFKHFITCLAVVVIFTMGISLVYKLKK